MLDETDDAYTARVNAEIEIYANQDVIHNLPEIFHLWSNEFSLPGVIDVFGVRTVNDFYAEGVLEASKGLDRPTRMLSLGCGYGDLEIEVAQRLIELGFENFEFVCADISPVLMERMMQSLPQELVGKFSTAVADVNQPMTLPGKFDFVMVNHALHHFIGLETLFDFIRDALTDNGIFATSDIIGRNGHQRWPECMAFLQALWPLLSQEQRVNRQHSQREQLYIDKDCSLEGFEGVRAEDILPLILERMHSYKFFGYAGLTDIFVDRGYGHNFNREDEHDATLITAIGNLGELLLDAGVIKPTLMFAWFTKHNRGERYYRDRSAARSIRDVDAKVPWAEAFLKTLMIPEPERIERPS